MSTDIHNEIMNKIKDFGFQEWEGLMSSITEGKTLQHLHTESTTERTRRVLSKIYGKELFNTELVEKTLTEINFWGESSDFVFAISTGQHDMLDRLIAHKRLGDILDSIHKNPELAQIIGRKRRFN